MLIMEQEDTARFMMECADYTVTEMAIHDARLRIASFMYYDVTDHRFTIGRNWGWGSIPSVNINGIPFHILYVVMMLKDII